jgi:DNA-binding SARP family transcriptional activator
VRAFEEAVAQGTAAAEEVLALYRGDFVPEEPYTDWIMRERERLHGIYLNALVACLEAHMRRSAWREALLIARRLLEREPWLEEVWRAQITCYLELGRRSEALQAYRDCEEHLRRELDAAPGPLTRALHERLEADH